MTKTLYLAAVATLLTFLPTKSRTQQLASPLTLDQVLTSVQDNYEAYLHTIPDLFADEHLVSAVDTDTLDAGLGGLSTGAPLTGIARNVMYDSVFRLRRPNPESAPTVLEETRQFVAVNHRPPSPDQSFSGPNIVNNAFSYATSVVTPKLKHCYNYDLLPGQHLNRKSVIVVEYAFDPVRASGGVCPITESHSGRVFIDPDSMQVIRFEQKRPEHKLDPETIRTWSTIEPETLSTWSWSIDYAPVKLKDRIFWLPKAVVSMTKTNKGTRVQWSFSTSYRNYHLMDVHSTILPGSINTPRP